MRHAEGFNQILDGRVGGAVKVEFLHSCIPAFLPAPVTGDEVVQLLVAAERRHHGGGRSFMVRANITGGGAADGIRFGMDILSPVPEASQTRGRVREGRCSSWPEAHLGALASGGRGADTPIGKRTTQAGIEPTTGRHLDILCFYTA